MTYDMSERLHLFNRLQAIRKAPLAERKEAQESYRELMTLPEQLQQRAEWIFAGNYGYAEQQEALRIQQASKRANKTAQLAMLVAALECGCPEDRAALAWKSLSSAEREAADAAINRALNWRMDEDL